MSRQTYTVTTRVRIEQTFEVDAGCAQDAAEAAESYVQRELTGVDLIIDEPVRLVAKQIGPVVNVSTEEKAPVVIDLMQALKDSLAKLQMGPEPECDYLPAAPKGSM